ncbi:hypothetical protein [Hymenobacter jeollabukensis]|uniref:Uncharacterized protein n=1 Tax=Hymenobacter jeollabukensis TaxID=2025313 RepID=A0A5R8WWF3_9BACT|nr:hypothetical protein [Hymenobacter jeollabukensis]TLM96838.1 hypothetical protein FDY95_02275 [Hymenobacter jeollabukensis]
MFKKTLTIHALALLLLGGGVAFTSTSCNRADRQEAAAETDQAYDDFKTFVANTETNAEAVGNKTQAEWDEETKQLKDEYDAKVAAAEADMGNWDEARKQEYEQLKTRYTTAYDKRAAAYTASMSAGGASASAAMPTKPGKYYTPMNPAAQITAANARQTYESFVNNVKQNGGQYDIDDWRYVNAEWRALDEAYDKVKGDIPAKDLAEIQKEKLKYAGIKSANKTAVRAEQAVTDVKGEAQQAEVDTRDERSKVGQAASNTAQDVKQAGKDVGHGIGHVAKKVGEKTKEGYKEVKSEVKNTDND